MEEKNNGFTPDYIDTLLPNQIFVFGSNALGYHTGGASRMAYKRFGAVWGQPEGLQGQSYAIPVDFGKMTRMTPDVKPYIDRFIEFAKVNTDKFFLVTRVGCGVAGYTDQEMAIYFRDALELNNVSLPKSFVDALNGDSCHYDLERFVRAQDSEWGSYKEALRDIKDGHKRGHWIWYVFPQIKGLGHSFNSEFYGISGKDEARAYLEHPILGIRLRDITKAFLTCGNPSAFNILGYPDVLKFQSCMTLFDIVSPQDIFAEVLDKYYEGNRCEKTIRRLGYREEKLKNQILPSKLVITKDYQILLANYNNKEIKMEPIVKAIYLLFLKHPEGITFKCLPDFREELTKIYAELRPLGLSEKALQSIEDVTNPLLNSINEKCSRIRAAFVNEVDESLLNIYIVTGKSGEAKKIALPRDLVVWEKEEV